MCRLSTRFVNRKCDIVSVDKIINLGVVVKEHKPLLDENNFEKKREFRKTLSRMPKQGKIFGVCAGLADYFDMDVTLIRVLFVVATLFSGFGVVLYLILAVVLPVNNEGEKPFEEKLTRLGKDLRDNKYLLRSRNYAGFGLVVLGVWLLVGQFFPEIFDFKWNFVWPAVLILIGLSVIFRSGYDRK